MIFGSFIRNLEQARLWLYLKTLSSEANENHESVFQRFPSSIWSGYWTHIHKPLLYRFILFLKRDTKIWSVWIFIAMSNSTKAKLLLTSWHFPPSTGELLCVPCFSKHPKPSIRVFLWILWIEPLMVLEGSHALNSLKESSNKCYCMLEKQKISRVCSHFSISLVIKYTTWWVYTPACLLFLACFT